MTGFKYNEFKRDKFHHAFTALVRGDGSTRIEDTLIALANETRIPNYVLTDFYGSNPAQPSFLSITAAETIAQTYDCTSFPKFYSKAPPVIKKAPPPVKEALPPAKEPAVAAKKTLPVVAPVAPKMDPNSYAVTYQKPFGQTVARILALQDMNMGMFSQSLHKHQFMLKQKHKIDLKTRDVGHYLKYELDNPYGRDLRDLIFSYYQVSNTNDLKQFADRLEEEKITTRPAPDVVVEPKAHEGMVRADAPSRDQGFGTKG